MIATPAAAGSPRVCGPTGQIVERLDKTFGEHLTGAGLDASGNMVSVYSNPEKLTWTMTVTTPERVTCIVSSGDGWAYERPATPADPGRPS